MGIPILFYVLSALVNMVHIPSGMRSLKSNGPALTACLVLLFGIGFSSLFDRLFFHHNKSGLRGLIGGFVFTVGVILIGYEKRLQEKNKS